MHSKETIEKIRKSQIGRKFSDEHREKLRQAHLGKKLSPAHRLGVVKTLKQTPKGGTFEETFGPEVAKRMKEKMRLAKLGKKMPWNKGFKKEAHPRWKKDRTQLAKTRNDRGDTNESITWAREVKKRDGWKCMMPDKNCVKKIEAHHILGYRSHPELRYKLDNGISLCQFHHPRKRSEEQRLIPIFKELVGSN